MTGRKGKQVRQANKLLRKAPESGYLNRSNEKSKRNMPQREDLEVKPVNSRVKGKKCALNFGRGHRKTRHPYRGGMSECIRAKE